MEGNKHDSGEKKGLVHINTYTRDAFERLDRPEGVSLRESKLGGISYGFDAIDWLTCGIQPDDFIIIAARSSMGKTDFLVNIAQNVVGPDSNISVVFFSMKLSAVQIHKRFICSRGKVRTDHYSMGNLEDIEWPSMVSAAGSLHETPLFIDDSPVNSLEELRQKITTFQTKRKIGLIVIDSLQHLSDVRDQSDTSRVACLSRSIKSLARELEIPVLASVHLSGSAQHRFDKRPFIEDLEAWESITEYADVVGFLHCEEGNDNIEDEIKVLAFIIRKNINGGLGEVSLLYKPVFHLFSEVHIVAETPMKN